jgi:GNAT superfamily N-acetyltransferase
MASSGSDEQVRLLGELEHYYDEVPRVASRTEEIGPFTLFVQTDPRGWPYYARPRLGHAGPFTPDDVRVVRDRQRELGIPEAFEWVHENTPALTKTVRRTDLGLAENPLMVLADLVPASPAAGLRVELLAPDHPDLGAVMSAVHAGFGATDDVGPPRSMEDLQARLASGSLRVVGAFDAAGPVGGGSHSPRAGVTELTGIAVLPRARRRGVGAAITAALVEDALGCGVSTVFLSAGSERVADIYARVGFVRVGTACVAEASEQRA